MRVSRHSPLEDLILAHTRQHGVKASQQFKTFHTFQMGDVVVLNSGGPNSLIVDLDGRGNATASWRAPDGEMQELEMPEACFTLVRPVEWGI